MLLYPFYRDIVTEMSLMEQIVFENRRDIYFVTRFLSLNIQLQDILSTVA